jgi:hypothetical protein
LLAAPRASAIDRAPTASRLCEIALRASVPEVLPEKRMSGPTVFWAFWAAVPELLPSSFSPVAQLGSSPAATAGTVRCPASLARETTLKFAPFCSRPVP